MHNRRIGWTTIANTNQRLDDAAALNLMVILPDDPFLASDIRMGKQCARGVNQPRTNTAPLPRRWQLRRAPRCIPHGFSGWHWYAFMQEMRVQRADFGAVPIQANHAVIAAKFTQIAELHPMRHTHGAQALQLGRRHGQHHAFLCFRNPNFSWTQAVILHRRAFKIDGGANVLTHFSNCA